MSQIIDYLKNTKIALALGLFVGFSAGAIYQGLFPRSLAAWLDSEYSQNVILIGSVIAAFMLFWITSRTAQNRAAMAILIQGRADGDLIKNERSFNNIIVWYKNDVARFSETRESYIVSYEAGNGVTKAATDPRLCRCNCDCRDECNGKEDCRCDCDTAGEARQLTPSEYSDTRRTIKEKLNYNEYLSIGMEKGAYREQILKDASRTTFVRHFIDVADYIHKMRTTGDRKNPALYIKFEKMALRWATIEEAAELNEALGRPK